MDQENGVEITIGSPEQWTQPHDMLATALFCVTRLVTVTRADAEEVAEAFGTVSGRQLARAIVIYAARACVAAARISGDGDADEEGRLIADIAEDMLDQINGGGLCKDWMHGDTAPSVPSLLRSVYDVRWSIAMPRDD